MIESTSMASLLTERCYRSTPRGVLTMLGGCASVRLEHASTTGAVYIED